MNAHKSIGTINFGATNTFLKPINQQRWNPGIMRIKSIRVYMSMFGKYYLLHITLRGGPGNCGEQSLSVGRTFSRMSGCLLCMLGKMELV